MYPSSGNPGSVIRKVTGGALAMILGIMLVTLPLGMLAGSAAAQDSSGLLDETTYESPQFDYTVSWDDTWSARQRDVSSNPGGFDVITLRNGDATLRVAGRSDDIAADEFLQNTVELITRNADTSEIVAETDGDVPSVELTADGDHVILEAHTLTDNGAVVVITLTARERNFADALATAQATVLLSEEPIFARTATPEATPSGTDDATEAATTEPVEDDATEATTEPVEEDATEVTETPADGEGTPVDDLATEPPADDPGEGITGATYTSPTYGFGVAWNDTVWQADARIDEEGFDELELISASGTLYIWAGDVYNGDPAACLDGEAGFYENEDPAITDWAPAEDADGEPITGETSNSAYGVFTLTYTDQTEEGAESVDLVDYIECRELVPGQAVMIVFATSTPEQYNDHIDDVLTVTNQIELGGEADPTSTTPAATPEASPDASGDERTGLAGTSFTSPTFGFSLDIPVDWSVQDEMIAEGDERLVMSNGVSTITLYATDAYSGDLEGCVGYARDLIEDEPAFTDLRLDERADGSPFQGSDDRGAYANFTYTGADNLQFAHFVQCQYIVEDESVLILSQDVPYDQYSAERQARRQIENAITLAE